MAWGFVYVLGNTSMPGIYKIGMTEKAPMERLEQLSMATACPTPFWLAMYIQVENPKDAEHQVHQELSHARINRSREFFRSSLREIGLAIRECFGEDPHWEIDGEFKVFCEDKDREIDGKRNHFFSQCADPIEWRAHRFEGFVD